MTFEEDVIAAVDCAVEDGAPMPVYVYEAYKALIESRQSHLHSWQAGRCVAPGGSQECSACGSADPHGPHDPEWKPTGIRNTEPAPVIVEWVETTMTNCLINDRIRIGAEETTVRASTHGMWNVDNRNAWHPVKWQHIELRLDLEAVPGLKQYPPAASIEILCTPERLAVLRIQEGFPGSAVTSSHVD